MFSGSNDGRSSCFYYMTTWAFRKLISFLRIRCPWYYSFLLVLLIICSFSLLKISWDSQIPMTFKKTGLVLHTCNPSTLEAQAEVQSNLGLCVASLRTAWDTRDLDYKKNKTKYQSSLPENCQKENKQDQCS